MVDEQYESRSGYKFSSPASAQFENSSGLFSFKKYIEDLENRLATVEHDLRRSGLAKDDASTEASSSQDKEPEAQSLCEGRSSIGLDEETSRNQSLISPSASTQRVLPQTDLPAIELPTTDCPGMNLQYWQGCAMRRKDMRAHTRFDKFQQQVFAPLFAEEPNQVFIGPVFDEIMAPFPFLDWVLFKTGLTSELSSFCSPSWRACVNAVLSMTVCFRAAKSAFAELQGDAWAYFKTAFGLLPQLMAEGKDLEAVEAMTSMSMFLRGTPDAQNLSLLVSSASRLYQIVSMRRNKVSDAAHDVPEPQRSSHLLWALHSMDQELVFRHGLSPVLDMRHQFLNELESSGSLDTPMINLFRKRTSLAVIQSQINNLLYSNTKPDLESAPLAGQIYKLATGLQQWSSEMHLVIPTAARASTINELELSLLIHVDDLYLAHYHTILMIYWPLRGFQDDNIINAPQIISSSDFTSLRDLSRTKCADASQETLLLIGHFYSLPFMSLWSFLSYFVSAHLTLFAAVLAQPRGLVAAGHLSAMEVFMTSLKLIISENGFDIRRVASACAGMTSISRAVTKAATAINSPSQSETDHITQQAETALDLVNQATSPMYIAQNWMSNLKNKDYDISVALARVLGIPWDLDQRYGPLVPEALMPETYAFGFAESKEYSMYRK
ncbi:hypothetical protein PFICI_07383 [Pestalotiopsis fici W106-1]|uniref:Transcription factor domain-containing protein n=1 Tax=Pestalotiopsis fici (strain W106-1 / CGMCC3.15140) TaxID=1229662 RepID=W3X1G5_PESFW|nr:uncharacterized protein PFICI_07383 [Pestalotiopsis fici W106-1]ETS79854.1 hypothetical protein PFICI_07383 [Pestalotiopsis fici W106-1]